ncbi:EscU/YscU/HrcU family type III secretion system export apparatus switch protein [Pseudomonas fuscovaginae UPB0736]|uniref:Type III secretion protein U n=1 Tax=Pseudomonas asplenii TaxID=53407 RepID=A0A1H6NLP6_9PSED|nr:EscU/YscU/HrcU family type III secretion system export apparatus switch protein [Pseudomonas fuscovaginae]UUQ66097.1 EscU/YscU/HrcU family type III secretion system export apparatus switch protein [Pseudomonas fuscovaginae UPB0736]SEI14498.1 type III secretion protein U [Pseudomonas fuscovaginae]
MSSSASKTEQPTPKRLRDSARKGQTFKAKDLVISCMMLCAILFLVSGLSLLEVMEVYRRIIAAGLADDTQGYTAQLLKLALLCILPLALVCVLSSALPALLQSGFALASEALKLNLGALNPLNGFKKLFSLRTLKDSIKAVLYLGSFAVALWVVWHSERQALFAQLFVEPLELFPLWGRMLLTLLLSFMACASLIVLLDALCEYWLHIKDLKMDLHSVKREHKEQDGDPQIKQKRRHLHLELLSEQVRSDIRGSRVIVANPTHIAIGIYFRPDISFIPLVSVIETNQRALAVRAYAREMGIAVVSDIRLARRIYRTHQRYSFIQLEEIEEVLRLLIWLEQVEQA